MASASRQSAKNSRYFRVTDFNWVCRAINAFGLEPQDIGPRVKATTFHPCEQDSVKSLIVALVEANSDRARRLQWALRNFLFGQIVCAADSGSYSLGKICYGSGGEAKVRAARILAANEGTELVRRCRAGEGAAWEQIVRDYSRRIYNLAYRFTSRADAAEDLTQEVFVRIYKSLDQYDARQGDLQNWLMRLARNLIIDDYRKRQRTPHDNQADDLADHTYHLHNSARSVHQEMERRELGAQVQAGIDKLSPDLRTCVILRDIEELSYQEIVELLKIPEGTVKSRINRGRIELAKILKRMKVLAVSEA